MKITVCIGSSCHLKGSRQVVEKLQKLVDEHNLKDKIILCGTFCMGNCQKGVSTVSLILLTKIIPKSSFSVKYCLTFKNKIYSSAAFRGFMKSIRKNYRKELLT